MREKWKDVPGYEGCFQVSDRGRVRSLDRYVMARGGKRNRLSRGKILKGSISTNGYRQFNLSNRPMPAKTMQLHIAVMLAFVGPRPDDHDIHHINGNKLDNRIKNLTYLHMKEHRRGVNHPAAQLTESQVKEIFISAKRGERHKDIAESHKISRQTVTAIHTGKIWGYVTQRIPQAMIMQAEGQATLFDLMEEK